VVRKPVLLVMQKIGRNDVRQAVVSGRNWEDARDKEGELGAYLE